MKKLLLTLSLLLSATCVLAQSIAVKETPGEVSREEVEMMQYSLDTTANAVYLVNNFAAYIDVTDNLELTMNTAVYSRIKILKEAGKSLADFKIHYRQGDFLEGIKVVTYNMVDGKVVQTKLDKKYIFRQNVSGNNYVCSFSAPEVRVGSVIEVSFQTKNSRYWEIPSLVLQHAIPANISKGSFQTPDFLVFNRFVRGFINPVYAKESYSRTLHNLVKNITEITKEVFTMTDVPAMPDESYSMNTRQYRTAVYYELSAVSIPGYLTKSYSLTWEDVDRAMRESAIFSQMQVKGKFLEPFISAQSDETAALTEVRNAVAKAVKWNGVNDMVPSNIKEVVKAGTGSSADINALVASVLNSMGYKTSPVFFRRRTSGILANMFIRMDAFNGMVLLVQTPFGQTHILDAAPDYGFLDALNPDFLTSEARVIPIDKEQKAYWLDLTGLGSGKEVIGVDASLDEDGIVRGKINMKAHKESSYVIKMSREAKGTDDKYFAMVENGEDFESVSYEFMADGYSPSAAFTIDFEQNALQAGDVLYIKPCLVTEHHPGDFPPGERQTPVDFPIMDNMTYIYTLHLPEGYTVEELPSNINIRCRGHNIQAFCQYGLSQDGRSVTLRFVYKNTMLMFPKEDYQDLRAFWEQLCSIYNHRIVIRKP